eukprot:8976777-Alexandrium_andersonii.AAC.1
MAGPPGSCLRRGAREVPVLQPDLLGWVGLGAGQGPRSAVEGCLVPPCGCESHIGLELGEVGRPVLTETVTD